MADIVASNAELCEWIYERDVVKEIEAGERERALARRRLREREAEAAAERERRRSQAAAAVRLDGVLGQTAGSERKQVATTGGKEGEEERASQRSFRLEHAVTMSLDAGVARTLAIDPSNRLALVGDSRGTATWLRLPGLTRLATTSCSPLALSALSPSPTLSVFAAADVAGQLAVWDAEARVSLWKSTAHRGAINDICWAPTAEEGAGASVFATCAADGDVALWDVRTGAAVTRWRRLSARHGGVGALLCSPTEPHLIAGTADGSLVALSLRLAEPLGARIVHRAGVRVLARAPHDFSLVSGAADGVRKFQMPTLAYEGKYPEHRHGMVTGLAVGSDDALVVGLGSGAVRVHRYTGGELLADTPIRPAPGSIGAEAGVTCLALDRTETRVVAGVGDRTIRCWRLESTA
jgi:pleiotropic regulator 1